MNLTHVDTNVSVVVLKPSMEPKNACLWWDSMKQLRLKFNRQCGNVHNKPATPPYSEYFDFVGRAKHERRDGQFQYRYGQKVQPKDECLSLGQCPIGQ